MREVAAAAVGSIKSLAQLPIDSAGAVLTGIAGGVAWALGAGNVSLLWIVGLAMLLDMIVGGVRAVDDPLQKFDVRKLYGGIIGKLFRILLIPTASLIDWLIIVSPMPLPAGYERSYPVTALVMYALAAAELTSCLDKFRDGGIAPGLIAEIMRHMDRTKLGQEPPVRRDYDVEAVANETQREFRKNETPDA